MVYMAGIVIDKDTREPIEGATIVMKDEMGEHIKRYEVESEPGGKFKIDVEYRDRYLLVANKNGYFQKEMSISTNNDPLETIVVEMQKYDYAAEGLVMHGETAARGQLPLDVQVAGSLGLAGTVPGSMILRLVGPDRVAQTTLDDVRRHRW